MRPSKSLDLYLDYLLHKDELRNLFTLYYQRDAVVGKTTRCFTPAPSRMGWVEISESDVEVMGFFDWVGVIVRCALYLREDVPRRVVAFATNREVDEKRLQWALDIELNEKAKQEALVYREACHSHLLEWDRRSLADYLSRSESEMPEVFEAIYALLTPDEAESEDEGEGDPSDGGMSDVMMPMGIQGDTGTGRPQEDGEMSLSAGSFGVPSSPESSEQEVEGYPGSNEGNESGEVGDKIQPDGDQGSHNGDMEEALGVLSEITEDEAVSSPAENENIDSALIPWSGYSPSGMGPSGIFVKQTDHPLEDLVTLVIKSATGEKGKEKGKEKMKWATHWAGYHRRFAHAQLMLGDDVVLPPKRKKQLPPRGKGKFRLQIYLDTSGSCANHAKRFFSLVTNMSPEKFEITLCSFSTKLKTHDIESKRFDYLTGGTNIGSVLLHAVENEAEKEMDAIVVLTDGKFNSIKYSQKIKRPEKWHWVLTPRHYKESMPKGSHFYTLPV